jgi:hypothetical protein
MASRRACRVLASGAFICFFALQSVAAQQTSSSSARGGDDGSKLPVSLDRIREGIQREPKLKIDFLDPDIPLFRISVQEKALALEDYWKIGPDTAVSRDVRPSYASTWHHEYLSMVTPKQQIAASPFGIFGNPVHPVGPPILEIGKAFKQMFSNGERGRIRRQIQEELKALEANQSPQATQTPEPAETAKPKTPPPSVPNDPR